MNKDLESKLRRIQGIQSRNPHDNFILSAQIETIFMLDKLSNQIGKLNKTIEESDKQSQRLERSNYRLQWAMLILTAIATIAVVYPFLVGFSKLIDPFIAKLFNTKSLPLAFMTSFSAILSTVVAVLLVIAEKTFFEKRFSENIKLDDRLQIILRDKDGNIKDKRV